MDRRNFLFATAASVSSIELFSNINKPFALELEKQLHKLEGLSLNEGSEQEDFWSWIRQSYTTSPNIINLNNGGVSPQPKVV